MGKRVVIQLINPKTNDVTNADIVTTSDNIVFADGQTLTQKMQNINTTKAEVQVTTTLPANRDNKTIYFKI